MERIKVLISFGLPTQYIRRIEQVSPLIKVAQSHNEKENMELIPDADVLFAGYLSPEMFRVAKNLKWIQTQLVGVDRYLFPEVIESTVILTNAGGVNSTAVSEHVIGMMLCLSRKLHFFIRNQTERKWKKSDAELLPQLEELSGKTLGVIGLGRIGTEIARKAKCLGMIVIATKRNVTDSVPPYVDRFVPIEELKQKLLAESDYVVLQLPLTKETEGMFGEEHLRSMKKTAYLINAGRGRLVREDTLIRALDEGWIAGAALDAFEVEPLPQTSILWSMKNVIVTPHVAGLTPQYIDRLTEIFCENLARFIKNEPLINVVDKKSGY